MLTVLLALIAVTQSAVATQIRLLGVSPDLMLVFVVAWAVVQGWREGLFVGIVGGFMLDVLSGAPFGLELTALAAISYLAGLGESNVFRTARYLPYIVVTLATLAYYILFLLMLQMTGRVVDWGTSLGRVALPATLLNALCMPLVYNLVRWIQRRFYVQQAEWER